MDWQLIFLCLWLINKDVLGESFYVVSDTDGVPCPKDAEICHNFLYYFIHGSRYLKDNATFTFLEGTHNLPDSPIVIEGHFNMTFQGLGDTVPVFSGPSVNQSTSVLHCSQGIGGIVFIKCKNILIRHMTVSNCSIRSYFYEVSAYASLAIYDSFDVLLETLSIQNSTNYGLFISNAKNVTIQRSVFVRNSLAVENTSNVAVVFQDHEFPIGDSDWSFEIIESTLALSGFDGLYLQFLQQEYTVNFQIHSSNIVNNNGHNIVIFATGSCRYRLIINKLMCNHSHLGVGFHFLQTFCITDAVPLIAVTNSLFGHNSYNAFSVEWFSNNPGKISISSSIFYENIGSSLIIQQIRRLGNYNGTLLDVLLINSTFEKNKKSAELISQYGLAAEAQFTIGIMLIQSILVRDCSFAENEGSGMAIYDSFVTFGGKNKFYNNTSVYGGAINLVGNGFINLELTAEMSFKNNHAEIFGGAIYVIQAGTEFYDKVIDSNSIFYCFWQLSEHVNDTVTKKFFFFQNNTAGSAGSVLYGDITDRCILYSRLVRNSILSPNQYAFFNNFSEFNDQHGNSVISSRPIKVCFCENTTGLNSTVNCSKASQSYESFPGSEITLNIAVVGNQNGLTPGVVQIQNANSVSDMVTTSINATCTEIVYSVKIKNSTEMVKTIQITTNEQKIVNDTFPLSIDIGILPCAKGFYLSTITGICECVEEASLNGKCFPSLQLVERSGNVWIGYDDQLNCTVVDPNCPFDYCLFSAVNVTLSNPSNQCAHDRIGRLCGRCPDSLSLVFGSNACKDCSENAYVLMIIPFGLAGIALVCFLLFLNLTVSVGTINGIVFFANIVKIYEPISPIKPIPFLSQFISWINLDLGIESCFYNKMSAIEKIVLQFVFPFYLWTIMIVIVFLSKCFPRLAKLLGNSGIPMLATLILLSFTKLLRTVILVLSITYVSCNGVVSHYWMVDPGQKYLHSWHILLFIIATLVMILLIFPYTVFLLFYPLFELSNDKCRQRSSWFMFKLKPIFDAYRGPHSPLFCFWPGALLLVRILLALLVALSDGTTAPLTVLLAILLVLVSILSSGRVYKNGLYILHMLDGTFLVGLMVLAYLIDRSYYQHSINTDTVMCGAIVIFSFSFVLFFGILLYHIYKHTWVWRLFQNKFKEQRNSEDSPFHSALAQDADAAAGKENSLTSTELREPLLEEQY